MNTKVLILDNDRTMRVCLEMMLLSATSFEKITEVAHGEAALDRVRDGVVDIIIMNVNIPNMDSVEYIKEILRISPQIKILAMSASLDERHILQVLGAGAKGHIYKSSKKNIFLEALIAVNEGEIYLGTEISRILDNRFQKKKTILR